MRVSFALCFFVCVFVLPSSGIAREQDHPAVAVKNVMAVLDEFMRTFNQRDMDSWSATLNYPHVRFASGGVSVWEDAEAYAARPTFATLESTGWDHSHWISREVTLASPDKVHVDTTFQRFNSANEPIGTYRSLYIVTRDPNGRWGVQARSSLAP